MLTKLLLIILLLAFSAPCFAQVPRIDSMFVNESQGILYIHGSFGITRGIVNVDNVRLSIVSWADSLISVNIPDTGKGSMGPVLVGAQGYPSNVRFLSGVSVYGQTVVHVAKSFRDWIEDSNAEVHFNFSWRADLHSFFINHSGSKLLILTARTGDKVVYDFNQNLILINEFRFPFFNDYELQSSNGIVLSGSISEGRVTEEIYHANLSFFPSHTVRALFRSVNLISPKNHTDDIDKWNVMLTWNLLSYIDTLGFIQNYHAQVASDSLFKNLFFDETISDSVVHLPSLSDSSKYYWHVAAKNSEGESRWSDVWSFNTSTKSGVERKTVSPNIRQARLSSDPIASNAEAIITLNESIKIRMEIMDILGNVRQSDERILSAGESRLPVNTSSLASGVYICRLQAGDEVRSLRFVKE